MYDPNDPFCIKTYNDLHFHNCIYCKYLVFSYLATMFDAILDFLARHRLCQFMPAVSYTTEYRLYRTFLYITLFVITGAGYPGYF